MTDVRQAFIDGMSYVAATVNVVTTNGPAGKAGVTVSAMSSVSADTAKPTLLVCINEASAGAAPIIENGVFAVNILRDDQSFVSDTFAGRYGDKGDAKFGCAEWDVGETGSPLLNGALVSFDCKLVGERTVGSHHVFFGEVEQVRLPEHGRALIYSNRSYGTPLSLPSASATSEDGEASRLSVACVSSFAPLYVPNLLLTLNEKMPDLRIDVLEGDQAQVTHLVETGEAELALLYDRHMPDDRHVPGILETDALVALEPYVLLPEKHRFAEKSECLLAELAEEPLVLLEQPLSRDYIMSAFAAAGVNPKVAMRTPSFEMLRSLVGNGLGYAMLVTRPATDLSYDGHGLLIKPIADPVEQISISLAKRKDRALSDAAKAYADECRSVFRSNR